MKKRILKHLKTYENIKKYLFIPNDIMDDTKERQCESRKPYIIGDDPVGEFNNISLEDCTDLSTCDKYFKKTEEQQMRDIPSIAKFLRREFLKSLKRAELPIEEMEEESEPEELEPESSTELVVIKPSDITTVPPPDADESSEEDADEEGS